MILGDSMYLSDPVRLKSMINDYRAGVNLTKKYGSTLDTLEVAYELQSGEYTRIAKENKTSQQLIFAEITRHTKSLVQIDCLDSFLEIGIGEGNSFLGLITEMELIDCSFWGIDISWSRLSWAKNNFELLEKNISLACASAFSIPLPSDSIDLVFTVHAMEPNGSKEIEFLREMMRVSCEYLVLVEPDFEKADSQQQGRMSSLGYVTDIRKSIAELDLEILLDIPLQNNFAVEGGVAINAASLFILRKRILRDSKIDPCFVAPNVLEPLDKVSSGFMSEGGLFFPELDSIPFLRPSDALLALKPAAILNE
jgi:SAM-dependent methyltransferase